MRNLECLFCEGSGQVEGWINGELAETWECPDCNGSGKVNSEIHQDQVESNDALAIAINSVKA